VVDVDLLIRENAMIFSVVAVSSSSTWAWAKGESAWTSLMKVER
jgi:hypothetical protein